MANTFRHIIYIAALIFIISCNNTGNDKKSIIVTIPPLQNMLQEIIGDKMEATSLLDYAANPESFDPSLSDIRKVVDADAYFTIGHLPIENALLEKLSSGSKLPVIYNISKGVELLRGTHNHCHHGHGSEHDEVEHDEAEHDETHGDEIDPHIWSSYRNMRLIAANMLEYVCQIDPANSNYYTDNYKKLDARLEKLDNEAHLKLYNAQNSAFMVMHPTLSYFANDYNLKQLPIGSENKELSILQMREAIAEAMIHDADLVVMEDFSASRQNENIIKELNLKTAIYNPLAPDWEAQLSNLVNVIKRQ